jgi:uncharacterized pyridoxal phosphate-containing UPF0001 family protein
VTEDLSRRSPSITPSPPESRRRRERVQEARDKAPCDGAARWHLIGHLQSNKAKDAVRSSTSSRPSTPRARGEDRQRSGGEAPGVLLQVNIGREPQKSGSTIDDVASVANESRRLLDLRGLMTIPPPVIRRDACYFRELRTMRDDLGLRSCRWE